MLPGCGAANALVLAERLRQSVATEPLLHEGQRVPVSLGLGVAGWDGKQRLAELLRMADTTLYQAKNASRTQLAGSAGLPVTCWPAGS